MRIIRTIAAAGAVICLVLGCWWHLPFPALVGFVGLCALVRGDEKKIGE